jgi:hypothetical protein
MTTILDIIIGAQIGFVIGYLVCTLLRSQPRDDEE